MILITGATGLVGAHLALRLVENNESVRAIYRNESAIAKTKKLFDGYGKLNLFSQIEWIQGDITELPQLTHAFEQITQVYHCAGLISFDPADEELLRKTNIEGTANVVNLCLSFEIQKLCYVSSIATIGNSPIAKIPCNETHEWNPELLHTDYAISKYGAEMEIWRGYQEGLSVVIVNPGVILGPYFWETGSGELFTKVAQKFPFYTRGATGFVGVDDVVQLMVQLMEKPISGERYILVAENLTYEAIVKQIAGAFAVEIRWILIANWMLWTAWVIDFFLGFVVGKKRVLSKQLVRTLSENEHYSSEKISKELNYSFVPISTVINETAQLFKKN
ncbi:MAG: NAD-dependent epimerase/dehydratase family protein [Flavobacterium sp.]|nr:NAD-dependent epimerase/dehydratase family protein [Flavobacterium sp.]